jgi:tetratricopeptide (TPR) repeat protein
MLGLPPLPVYEELRQAAARRDWKFCVDLARFTLTRLSGDAHPEHRIRLQMFLAEALRSLPGDDRTANLEAAIASVQDAIATPSGVTDSSSISSLRVLARQRLGHLYLERIQGDRVQNIEDAIGALEQAVSESASQSDLTSTAMLDLSLAYFQRVRGDRSQNLERSLTAAGKAAETASHDGDPAALFRARLSSAFALTERPGGVREDNLDQALAAVNDALRVITREGAPFQWATAMHTRGTVLRNRVRGGRAENQEEAIDAFSQALTVLARDDSPGEWANCMFSLGAAYAERLRGDRRRNLEAAARALNSALEVLSPAEDLTLWTSASISLGVVYAESARSGATGNLERAIDTFGRVLNALPRETDPEQWARTTRNLGLAYLDRREGDRADNVEQAILAFGQSLEVFTRPAAPMEWAHTLLNLGLAYQLRLRGDAADNAKRAVSALRQALEVFTVDAFPSRHASVQRALGHPHFDAREWAEAYEAYAAALNATGALYESSVVPDARTIELRQSQGVPGRAAYALAHLGRASEAVALLERQAAQGLSQVLSRNEAALRDASEEDRHAFREARARIERLEATARREAQREIGSGITVVSELRQAQHSLRETATRIRTYVPEFMPESMTFAEISGLAQELGHPIVYLITTSHGSLALVVLPGSTQLLEDGIVWLDEFGTESASSIMEDRASGETGYLHQAAGTAYEGDPSPMMRVLDRAWPSLVQSLMGPVARRVSDMGFTRAALIARDDLALLPLHAVAEPVYFTFAPSARALKTALGSLENRARHAPVLLGVGNPLGAAEPLPFAGEELRAVASHFPEASRRTMTEGAATRVKVLKEMPGATHLHFACHASFNDRQPLMSWLELAGEDRLTLLDLLEGAADLSAARLVVLSACQTGLADFRGVPSEAVGFPAAFLQGGVPGVVSALWPVDDVATAVLMEKFYELLLSDDAQGDGRVPPAEALRRAQDWLRRATADHMGLAARYKSHYQQTGNVNSFSWTRYYAEHPGEQSFAHPYFWAGFMFAGV